MVNGSDGSDIFLGTVEFFDYVGIVIESIAIEYRGISMVEGLIGKNNFF